MDAVGGMIGVMDRVVHDLNCSVHGFVGPQSLVAVQQIVPLITRFSDLTAVS